MANQNNFINIGLPTDSFSYYLIHKNYQNFLQQSHYTLYELNMSQSGFLDARQAKSNPEFANNQYYLATYQLYALLTDPQKFIFDYYICSGFSQTEITKIKKYNSSRSVLFHLEAIHKKLNKIFSPQRIDLSSERRIADPYTGRYIGESTAEWFKRMEEE